MCTTRCAQSSLGWGIRGFDVHIPALVDLHLGIAFLGFDVHAFSVHTDIGFFTVFGLHMNTFFSDLYIGLFAVLGLYVDAIRTDIHIGLGTVLVYGDIDAAGRGAFFRLGFAAAGEEEEGEAEGEDDVFHGGGICHKGTGIFVNL